MKKKDESICPLCDWKDEEYRKYCRKTFKHRAEVLAQSLHDLSKQVLKELKWFIILSVKCIAVVVVGLFLYKILN